MTGPWAWAAAVAGAFAFGVLTATAFWWLVPTRRLSIRWSAPVREALEAGFVEQALQQRLRAQADAIWARQQQEQWREDIHAFQSRQETRLVAEIRLLMGSRARPTPVGLSPRPGVSADVAGSSGTGDAQIDTLSREIPEPGTLRRRVLAAPRNQPPGR